MSKHLSEQTHIDYTLHIKTWEKCRHAKSGEDEVKRHGDTYLPKLDGQTSEQYEAYKLRARYYNAFGKTIDGHIGLATRKEAIVTVPTAVESLIEDVNRSGAGMGDYLKSVLTEILEVNRAGTLIEHTRLPKEGATTADAKGGRPYLVLYKAEDIRDWEYSEDGELVYVLLREIKPGRTSSLDPKNRHRYRELVIENGVYQQNLHHMDDADTVEQIFPTINHKNLSFIPFVIHQSEFGQEIQEPPLLDLVNLCMSYYRLKADHAHALHFAALPTPWVSGVDADDPGAPKTIGPENIWFLSSPQAKAGMLEFEGAGVEAIQSELRTMQDQMAILGSRVLLPELSEHTATASKLRSISETSDLATMVLTLEKQANGILELFVEWAGVSGETEVDMATDFMPTDLDAQMLLALVQAWQSGAIDYETLVNNFKKAELIPAERDIEELKKAIDSEDEDRIVKTARAIADAEANQNPGNPGNTDE